MIGERIRMARERARLSQAELAARVGVTQQAVSGWESGYRRPDLDLLPKIAAACGVKIAFLLGEGEDEAPAQPLDQALVSGDWRRIALALADAQREHGLAARIRAEADRLAQENIRLALERGREDAGARVPGHSEAATIDAGD